MFAVLRHHGIPEAVVNAISVLYINSKSAVMVDGNLSETFVVTTGVLQGSASDLKRRKALSWCAIWKLERLGKCQQLPITTKVKLFKTTCVTILLYGCESWVISQTP